MNLSFKELFSVHVAVEGEMFDGDPECDSRRCDYKERKGSYP